MKARVRSLVAIAFIVFCSLAYLDRGASNQEYSLQISFIDVGQGDAALIQTFEGFNILIDGGPVPAGPVVLAYLRAMDVTELSAIIASHPDSDHIGGLISVLAATDILVDSVIYNGYPGYTQTWKNFASAVENEGLVLTVAQFPGELHWGATTAYVLNPPSGLADPDTNAASLVLLLDHNEVDTLFSGDIDSTVEAQVLARQTPVAADILKVAHHGSNYSSSSEFLGAVQPDDSVISVGPNPYGHPGAETLSRLIASGSSIWRTDLLGTILITSADGLSYQVIPTKTWQEVYLPVVMISKP
ncbi:MAG: MBL fold metallo-hydrolase [Anaerolineales bacterium]|nr:MBL fold metallo-hydrolase [Anaerolineae bacterium]PWB56616.1 MAG: MBL fold metallo-hydrolase [Anaerolineales bacterium]